MGADFIIQIACKQGIKLDSQHMPFGQQCPVLFDTGQETGRHIVFGKHDGFPEKCAAFGTADIKHVTKAGNVLQRNIRTGSCQSVGQTGAVHI